LNLITVSGHAFSDEPSRHTLDLPVLHGLATRLGGEHHVIGRAASGTSGVHRAGAVTFHTIAARTGLPEFVHTAAQTCTSVARQLGSDLVLTSSDVVGALVVLYLRRRRSAPVVVQVQGRVIDAGNEYGSRAKRRAIHETMTRAVRRADGVRALNAHIAEQVRAAGATCPIAVVGSRVDVDMFTPPTKPRTGRPRIGSVGSLVPVKNHEVLLLALAELRHAGVDVQLVLVGDGELRPFLERRARDLDIVDHVTFAGTRPYADIPALMQSFTIYAQASFSEGEPRALLEAQACARPAVVSDIPSHRGIVQPDRTGTIVPAADAVAWAKAFRTLVEQPDVASELGRHAREYVCAHHEFEPMLDRFADFLRDTGKCTSTA
jgi:glycosyltransferase involved in cell wall biosynthesis